MLSSASLMATGSSVMAASPLAKRFCVMSQASSAACWLDVATTQSVKPMVVRKTLMRGGSLGLGILGPAWSVPDHGTYASGQRDAQLRWVGPGDVCILSCVEMNVAQTI